MAEGRYMRLDFPRKRRHGPPVAYERHKCEGFEMQIRDLDFRTALKYAYLGDAIWREWRGTQDAMVIGRDVELPARLVLRNRSPWQIGAAYKAVDLNSDDILADDWVAESTDASV